MTVVVTHDHKVFHPTALVLHPVDRFDTVTCFIDYFFRMCAGLGAPCEPLDGDCCLLHFLSPFVFRAAARKGWFS